MVQLRPPVVHAFALLFPCRDLMLLELQISDFAIIDRLHLRFGEGLNVLTGETGAGKSIILDALGTLRGAKFDLSLVRAGSLRARVEGVFSLDDCPHVMPLLQAYALRDEDDSQLILTRELSAESGRSVARVNGRAVNTGVLREIGSLLLDLHGQHEGLALFNVRTHLAMLDRFGELLPLREGVSSLVVQVRQVREALAELRRNEARRQARIEELRFLIEDTAAADLKPGEEEALARERQVVQHAARITSLATDAYTDLYGGGESRRSSNRALLELIAAVAANLAELARIDPAVEALAASASELRYQLDDLAATLRNYRLSLDFEPNRINAIEDRLTVLRDLQRKYGSNLPQLLVRAANAEAEIERLANSARQISTLERQEAALLAELGTQVAALSRQRREIGDELARQIESAMADLAMPQLQFYTRIEHTEAPDGVPLDGRCLAFDKTGIDQIEFLISPNPGEPLKPLARIASGGESARLLLALKSVLARVDDVATLIFDEIDVGVGGRAGQVVGQKLWAITGNHQVICITHLPQVAAFADVHYHISKTFAAERTRTAVQRLEASQRIEELAAMLDGIPNEHSRANAQVMLERALAWKAQQRPSPATTPTSLG